MPTCSNFADVYRAAVSAGCILLFVPSVDAKPAFTTFAIDGDNTYVTAINAEDDVTGYYNTVSDRIGFIRAADGSVVTFDIEGGGDTQPRSINDAGAVAGFWSDGGFVRAADGTVTTFAVPGAYTTDPFGISNKGEVAGLFDSSDGIHGFVRTASGKIKTFDPPGQTGGILAVSAINDKGEVVGTYEDENLTGKGFLRAADGTITTIDVPGAISTYATGIDVKELVTGWYLDTSAGRGSFVRVPDGTITTFSAPDCPTSVLGPMRINRKGVVVGSCARGNPNNVLGFTRRTSGIIRVFHVPGAKATEPTSINDSGVVAGSYEEKTTHAIIGFLRIP